MGRLFPRFVRRTIKNGTVKIFGDLYRPDIDASKFDGVRAAFGIYYVGGERDRSFVSLWGTDEAYRDPENKAHWPGVFCENGVFYWEWWNLVQDRAMIDLEENDL